MAAKQRQREREPRIEAHAEHDGVPPRPVLRTAAETSSARKQAKQLIDSLLATIATCTSEQHRAELSLQLRDFFVEFDIPRDDENRLQIEAKLAHKALQLARGESRNSSG